MKILRLASLPLLLAAASTASAQSTEIEVNDGGNGTCYRATGTAPCSFFNSPTVDTFVSNGVGQSSEIMTTATSTRISTTDGVTASGLNIGNSGTALESSDQAGYAAAGTQTGTSSITGQQSGQFVATGENTSGQDSSIQLEGTVGFIRTRDTGADTMGALQTNASGTVLGYFTPSTGTPIASISSNAAGHQILGDTSLDGTFSVNDTSTMSGIDNQNGGISNAGLVTGVSAGGVSASSTDAVNGSQLYTTNANVATAQATADTANTNASKALSDAAAAKNTANVASANANTALTNAAAAQATANTANATATSAYNLATGFDTRVSSLEARMNGFDDDLERVDRTAARGVAIATALASMPDLEPGKDRGFGVGMGTYNGQHAVSAAFVIRASEHAKFRLNGGTAGDGKFAFGAGGMFSW